MRPAAPGRASESAGGRPVAARGAGRKASACLSAPTRVASVASTLRFTLAGTPSAVPTPMNHAPTQALSRPGEGYLAALGYLQIGTGVLSLTMSLMLLFQAMFSHPELLNPATAFSSSADLVDRAIATYVSLQLSFGWVAGGLQLAAGICCLRASRPRLIWLASVVSLANFPHGTMAAILVLLGLRRTEVVSAFQPRAGGGPTA